MVKLEIVLKASVGSMLPMPSGLSGSHFWSVTIAKPASHMNTLEIVSERAYCFQSWLSVGSTPESRRTARSIGTKIGSSQRTLALEHAGHVPAQRDAGEDGEEDRESDRDVFSGHGDPSEALGAQHRVHEVRAGRDAQ